MVVREIIIGNINGSEDEYLLKTPIEKFKYAYQLSKQRSGFIVYTNDVQFIEALEVFCGEDNLNIYFKHKDYNELVEISVMDAYNYVGNIYSILNSIRLRKELGYTVSDELIEKEINEYNDNMDGVLLK